MAGESCNLDKDEAEILKPSSSSSSSSSSSPSPSPPPAPPSPPSLCLKPPQELPVPEMPENSGNAAALSFEMKISKQAPPLRYINRCSTCRKKVGLTGFRCRCGDLFCASHRYSDTHDCSFDYKAAGREQIAKANPLIRAAKIIKI
ncbi:unnamed protein product [Musa acuminata subsp. malaccensis]|uniref:(wild Malaysian banana) hypothetical protein n=1 Tax=Musa acuminata subsp. malaccensis TaxID=214687 RepID=A0A804J9B9_MUSAM|nr:PREDICTED: zinc finger AN1 domain-containing stress-associated protein 15-like [Musa acuminata subsp. malaccensis]XP_009402700.1 PREDICTED: zinc finger AN1 domain-containing stress-associated protein 15-like [Musa acuminata subsp. malaccensis]XP_018681274.1 PREDICTED: zinc finger AN1 domain-containing stress-associated protein 15-like [Musa acuminata subsp. malaccensis]CAG1840076.1 unnamed protein product [Musa acuminata subsp. malaccensis]